jgi:hypothetical protein
LSAATESPMFILQQECREKSKKLKTGATFFPVFPYYSIY